MVEWMQSCSVGHRSLRKVIQKFRQVSTVFVIYGAYLQTAGHSEEADCMAVMVTYWGHICIFCIFLVEALFFSFTLLAISPTALRFKNC